MKQIKPYKKVLPFTITTIGGSDDLKKWKEAQIISMNEFKKKREAQVNAIKDKLVFQSNLSHETQTSEAFNKWKRITEDTPKLLNQAVKWGQYKEPSFFDRTIGKLYNFFININFN